MLRPKRFSLGTTLVEMMVVVLLSNIVLGGVLGIYYLSIKHIKISIELLNLKMELNVATDYMATQIRRSGYWNQLADGAPADNPFRADGLDISLGASSDCITFSYDQNGDGLLATAGTAGGDDRFGFRLNAGAIQSREPSNNLSCASDMTWENLTDTSLLTVTSLTFALTTENKTVNSETTVQLRKVTITATGSLVSDPTVTQTVTKTVKVRNNYLVVTGGAANGGVVSNVVDTG